MNVLVTGLGGFIGQHVKSVFEGEGHRIYTVPREVLLPGGKTLQEMQIPFVVFGKGVRAGSVINNSTMIYDTAATIAWIFGLKQPQVWIGRPITEAFK